MKHIEALNRPIEGLAHKDMLTRAMGKFYTPDFITERLSAHLLTQIDFARYDTFSLSDPFCGDGRLIVSFLRKAMEKEGSKNIRWHVSIWDYDTKAISDATQNIEQAAASALCFRRI